MIITRSRNGVFIRLTVERWKHIISRHPELATEKDRVMETISNPDAIQKGDFGEFISLKFYKKSPLTSKHLVLVYKELECEDGFIITAYYTAKPSERRLIIWKQ